MYPPIIERNKGKHDINQDDPPRSQPEGMISPGVARHDKTGQSQRRDLKRGEWDERGRHARRVPDNAGPHSRLELKQGHKIQRQVEHIGMAETIK